MKIKKREVRQDLDDLRTTVETLRMQMGPANADRSLERIGRVEQYLNQR